MLANRHQIWTSAEVSKLVRLLHQGSSYAETLLNRLPCGVAMLSRDGELSYANAFINNRLPELPARLITLDGNLQAVLKSHHPVKSLDLGLGDHFDASLYPFDAEDVLLLIQERDPAEQDAALKALAFVTVPVFVTDGSRRIFFANEAFAKLTGYELPELLSCELGAIADLNAEPGLTREVVLRQKSGKTASVVMESSPMPYRNSPALVCTIVSSAAQLLQPEERRMVALERVSGQIAHRFNNMLTVVLAYSDLIARQYKSVDPLKADVDRITEASKEMMDLAEGLLMFSRGRPASTVAVNVGKVVVGMTSMFRTLAGDTAVLVHPRDDAASVRLAVKDLEVVLLHLVRNAKESIGIKPGTITITTEAIEAGSPEHRAAGEEFGLGTSSYIMLSIADTGAGIRPEYRADIFEPFFTTKPGAMGLGLSVTYGIVKRAGGKIGIRTSPNGGTTVRIYLPQVVETPDTK